MILLQRTKLMSNAKNRALTVTTNHFQAVQLQLTYMYGIYIYYSSPDKHMCKHHTYTIIHT